MNSEVFKPIRGTEASILSQVPQKGYVFFALDTKKIYYGDGESFLPMGGNTGVWYGKMEYAETPEESQVEFDFGPDDIEGNEEAEEGKYSVPNVDDLIFNNPDSSFYRVLEVENSSSTPVIHCKRLTVAGGGGGPGGGGSNVGTMTVSRIGDQTINTLQGNSCYISYRYIARDAAGEETGPGTTALYVGGILKNTYVAQQGDNKIDVGPYLEIGTNNIRIVVSGNVGGTSNITQAKNWTVVSTNLALTWNYDETTINTADNFTFDWQVSISLEHTTFIEIDGLYTLEAPSLDSSRSKTLTINRHEYGLTHGAHEVTMYAKTTINNTTFTSAAISHMIICVDENRSDTIISVKLSQTEMDQYDTLQIPIVLYDPTSSNGKVSATLREDGVDKDSWTDYTNGVQYYWNYTPTVPGNKILSILSGTTEKVLRISVNDLGLAATEVTGYEFKFKASDITSNGNLRNWSYGGSITPSFSEDFDWVNGGLKSEVDENGNVRNYIGIKAGNTMSFNYKPLANTTINTGFTMKIIFKANECRSYDANILTIGSSTDNVYLTLKANEGIFQPQGEQAVRVPYCEDSYIEFEIDLWPYGTGQSPYLMTWLDGVPASAVSYSNNSIFFQRTPADIVVGSNDCDVQLYMIKVYKKHLSNEQHLINFIMDAPNAIEIVKRYNRNNILDDNGEISYSKLIEKNPNCDVYLYEIPRMTTTKKDKVEGCTYKRYKGSTSPLQTAEDVTMAVQGTSSAAYGLAAFNFNSTFNSGFTDYTQSSEGVHIDDWAMNENAIPIHDFNTKVNVASCEGVNNALNQEWYNKYVPYVTEYKKKNPKSRHTMEFMNMGVVFIKDFNQNVNNPDGVQNNVFNDTEGYIANPYYKMYSICNMGNIKRNEGVFSDLDNPYDVIMENPDNQSVYQQMTGVIDENNKLLGQWEGDKFYPILTTDTYEETGDSKAKEGKTYYTLSNGEYVPVDGLEVGASVSGLYELIRAGGKALTEVYEWRAVPADLWDEIKASSGVDMRKEAEDAWTGLVAWFAINNPEAATNEPLDEPETYPAYTFRGYTSRADRIDKNGNTMPAYTPSKQILKGLTISKFAGTYTTDSRNRRLAKMLSECEDHLIMDEIVFHYLFIERHALIDNVAKNTFWHTEDLQHWSMIKDYDNDTSDGNDNSGHLTLTYGYEVLDHVDHDDRQSMVFNAAASVWLHFINELLEARTAVYLELDKSEIGAWDAEPYLNKFEEWQSSLPERVWIEDYYRKYLRPKEVYGATQFLPMLEGGKKTHQRRQFETYQEAYMSSEYHGRICQNSLIDIRANGKNINQMRFPMTMYADCYIRAAAGSGHDANVRERYRRGQTLEIQLPVNGDANDMTTYFYLAKYITSLGGIEQLKPKKVDISAAYRLREFSMDRVEGAEYYVKTSDESIIPGKQYYTMEINPVTEAVEYNPVSNPDNSEIEDYYEVQISNQNLNLTEASFNNNRMLERLQVLDCPNATNSLDLTSATNLKYLNTQGSGFKGITIASNAPVETMLLNNTQVLSFTNLSKVSNFSMTGYDNLSTLYIDNIDNSIGINSKHLVEKVPDENGLIYSLQNVNWTIDDADEISDTNIDILDKVIEGTPYFNYQLIDKKQALSGTLTITADAYNGSHSLDLYEKYAIDEDYNFPNLDIIFQGSNAALYKVTILDGNNNEVWSKKTGKNYTITSAFLQEGPNGAFDLNKSIIKESTAAQTFTFSGSWQILTADTEEVIAIIDRAAAEDKRPYYSTQLNQDIVIKPVFIDAVRQYTITFINEGTTLSEDSYDYGTKINTILPNYTPIKDDSNLEIYETYAFKGYSLSPTATSVLTFTDDFIVNADMTYYAIYSDPVDVSNSINVHYDNFEFLLLSRGYTDTADSQYSVARGFAIAPKNGKQFYGKVTIPAYYTDPTTKETLPVISIGGFGSDNSEYMNLQPNLTGIFFETGTMIRKFDVGAFGYLINLRYLEMPDSLRQISDRACLQTNLKLLQRGQSKTSTTYTLCGRNVYYVGALGLADCVDQDCVQLMIPGGLIETSINVDTPSISNFNKAISLTRIEFGTTNVPSGLRLHEGKIMHLNYSGSALLSNIEVYLPEQVYNTQYIGNEATIQELFNPYYSSNNGVITGTTHSPNLTVHIIKASV